MNCDLETNFAERLAGTLTTACEIMPHESAFTAGLAGVVAFGLQHAPAQAVASHLVQLACEIAQRDALPPVGAELQ